MTLTAVASTQQANAPKASSRPGISAAGRGRGDDDSSKLVREGRRTFRFDTFGDQAFWGSALHLHLAIEGAKHDGVGPGLSPKAALSLGLKVDVNALPPSVRQGILNGTVDLNDPATTLALLKLNAVIGVKGIFNSNGTPWPRASATGSTAGQTVILTSAP
jgi:hypothetical protein